MSGQRPCEAVKSDGSACSGYATKVNADGRHVCFAHFNKGGRRNREHEPAEIPDVDSGIYDHPGEEIPGPSGDEKKSKRKIRSAKNLKRSKRQCDFLTQDGQRCKAVVLCRVDNGQFACRHHHRLYKDSTEQAKEMEAAVFSKRVSDIAKQKKVKPPQEVDVSVLEKAQVPENITLHAKSIAHGNTRTGKNVVIIGREQVSIPSSFPERLEARIQMAWDKLAWMNAWLTQWNKEQDIINTVETRGTSVYEGQQVPFETITIRHATFAELAIKMMDAQTKAETVLDKLLAQQQNLLMTSVMTLERMGYKFDHEAGMVMLAQIERAQRDAQGRELTGTSDVMMARPWPSDWTEGKSPAQIEQDFRENLVDRVIEVETDD
jgi:hypothetical protein